MSIILGSIVLLFCSCRITPTNIRKPAVAGQFYPSDPNQLNTMLNFFLSNVPPIEAKLFEKMELFAIVVPHAGYIFSGQVAAYGFKLLEGQRYDTVIILGLSHRGMLRDTAAIWPDGHFLTPLGKIPIDENVAKELMKATTLIQKNYSAHLYEHSIEVEVPFIQKVMPASSIVPILLGNPELNICRQVGESIASVIIKNQHKKKKILIVCSTDMSHYPNYKDAVSVDNEMLKVLTQLNPEMLRFKSEKILLSGKIPNLGCTFCSEGALYTTLYACKKLGCDKVEVLKYANSGDTPYGEKDRVVGYCAVGIFKSKDIERKGETAMKEKSVAAEGERFYLPEEIQKELLRLARESISTALEKREISYEPKHEELTKSAAVFVTLRKRGQLRGCIGTTVPQEPLYKAVIHMAKEAAFNDPRFPPVEKSELKDIEIEISVLSPLRLVNSADEIIPKVHGVYVRQGFRGGLYLPQVWEETGWTKEEFLNSLCAHKAGLPENAWKSKNTQIYVFTVFSFEEKK